MFWRGYVVKKVSQCRVAHCPAVHVYMHERGEGIAESLYDSWSKEFLEAGKRCLSGDTARQATSPEVKDLRSESLALKECGAEFQRPAAMI